MGGVMREEEILDSGGTLKVLRSALNLVYEEHIARLLAIPNPFLEAMTPDRRIIFQDVFDGYNKGIEAEISRYGDCLRSELTEVLERGQVSGFLPAKEAVIEVVSDFIDPDLYKMRFEKFLESIDRKCGQYGTDFGLVSHRLEIPRSTAQVGAENGCKRVHRLLLSTIDTVYLSQVNTSDNKHGGRGFYRRINDIYGEHPALFWLMALAISVFLGVVAL
tara:strand:+ start:2751 stop:3407 length:657 start_codon:yes stop_codon:yes gene_type:complete